MAMEAPSDGLLPTVVVCCPSAALQVRPIATVKINQVSHDHRSYERNLGWLVPVFRFLTAHNLVRKEKKGRPGPL